MSKNHIKEQMDENNIHEQSRTWCQCKKEKKELKNRTISQIKTKNNCVLLFLKMVIMINNNNNNNPHNIKIPKTISRDSALNQTEQEQLEQLEQEDFINKT